VAETVGERFVDAIAHQDATAIAACFTADAELRALIPPGLRERQGADEAAALIAGWFADSTELDLVESSAEMIGDRFYVGYRFQGVEEGEAYVLEQHLYCTLDDGKIARADLLCSGFRPRAD
jgi:ketosteroid isomerase-like protein